MTSNKRIGTTIPDIKNETIKSFDRQEDGTYKMTTKLITRNRGTGKIQTVAEEILDDIYEITKELDFDEELEFLDPDGKASNIRFKKIIS
jgi:hypothetical protein